VKRIIVLAAFALLVTATQATTAQGASAAPTGAATAPPGTVEASAVSYVASHPAAIHASSSDAFVQHKTISTRQGLHYVPYDRTYKGLPVVGGDFVVVTNVKNHVLNIAVAQDQAINVATTPKLTKAQAAAIASQQLTTVDRVESNRLVVRSLGTPRLAYDTLVAGHKGKNVSRLHVYVDALTGKVLATDDLVKDGTGTAAINGPNPVTIQTSGSGTSFSMTDPTRPGISCRNETGGAVLTGTDDVWGNGVGSNIETGCVDALFDVQHEWNMLGTWLGRNGINGSGSGFPVFVGLNDLNAFWNGSQVHIGHNQAGDWISSLDVVGHEFGHAIDSTTPGGQSSNGVSEATGDVFGALSEWFTNEPAPFDVPDYSVGEEINLVGSGPIRQMYNPSLVGDPNCYSSAVPGMETHAAAGPFDHWFVLAAQGSAASGGNPASPTCNGSTVTGIGIRTAGQIFYNAMLTKTAGMTYLRYRTATLNAAKNLTPGVCTNFNTIKAAWDAVSVPAQAGDPTCSASGTVTVNNPGNKTGTVGTAITSFTLTASPAASYTWTATGLPSGVTIGSTTGTVSGTPAVGGTFNVTVTATSGANSGSTSFTFTVSGGGGACSSPGQKLGNPGFEAGAASWTATAGVIGAFAGETAHSGTQFAWMDGYGTTHTDSISQAVAIPAGCTGSTLSFWLHIDTAETTTTVQFDKVTVTVGATTVATFSNLNKATGYALHTFNVGSFAGQTVTVKFTATEDSSLQTSFVVDDTALNAS